VLHKGIFCMRENDINYLIRHIGTSIKAIGDASLIKRGLTFSQMQLLFRLDHNGGKMSQKQLKDSLDVSHPTIVGLVQRLEKKGYVKSVIDENDKRNRIIIESPKAKQFKKEMFEQFDQITEKMFSNLNDKEKEELYRMLSVVNDSLNEIKEVKQNV